MQTIIRASIAEAGRLLDEFAGSELNVATLESAADLLVGSFSGGGKVLACGNGGSMCDAMHFAEEWTGRFRETRSPYPAIALSDPAHMSCVANDFGYEHVFARQVEALGRNGDVLLVLSTSGNSPSIVRAAEAAKSSGVAVLGMLGGNGGKVLPMCELALIAPGETSDRIQELHMLALHVLIEAVEHELRPRPELDGDL